MGVIENIDQIANGPDKGKWVYQDQPPKFVCGSIFLGHDIIAEMGGIIHPVSAGKYDVSGVSPIKNITILDSGSGNLCIEPCAGTKYKSHLNSLPNNGNHGLVYRAG